MGLADRIERRLESTVGDAFARVFGGSIVPQEVEALLRREAEAKARGVAGGRILAPNEYVITLSETDYKKVSADPDRTSRTFARHLEGFIHDQGWQTYGDVVVRFEPSPSLHTGQFRARGAVNPDTSTREPAPASRDRASTAEPGAPAMTDNPSYRGQGQGRPGDDQYDDRYRQPDEARGGYPQDQAGHPDQGGYPPRQGGYPDQGGYPQDQGGYPDQGYPPPSYDQRPPAGYGQPAGQPPAGYPDQGYRQAPPPAGYGQPAGQPPAGPPPGYGDYDYGRPPARQDEGYGRPPAPQAPGYPDQGGYPDHQGGYPDQGGYGGQQYGRADYAAPPAAPDYGRYGEPPAQAGYPDAGYGEPAGYDYGAQPAAAPAGYGSGYGAAANVTLQLDDGSGRTYQLREGANVIGRGQDAQFRLPDTGVSRRHLEIRWDGQIALLSDLNSTNGTTVNNAPVQEWQLADGDVIRLGHSEIIVRVH